mmetsp:Transcript_2629/g.6996  ORF Transcript_2629/g.6996 Transcript_2629/m.6996 type:complete len:229 (-) Transcript_2629:138-824(-)
MRNWNREKDPVLLGSSCFFASLICFLVRSRPSALSRSGKFLVATWPGGRLESWKELKVCVSVTWLGPDAASLLLVKNLSPPLWMQSSAGGFQFLHWSLFLWLGQNSSKKGLHTLLLPPFKQYFWHSGLLVSPSQWVLSQGWQKSLPGLFGQRSSQSGSQKSLCGWSLHHCLHWPVLGTVSPSQGLLFCKARDAEAPGAASRIANSERTVRRRRVDTMAAAGGGCVKGW